ncbi:S8 family serine peptidase [Shewanella waksmanii]|uniref:S8 family serine peptidase n=1 Tax=Shewanella waksmanii TaxID=213783 RepID=UPI0004BBB35D|nr:S8 family serine peptidase [Shewanella waksmanii]
MNNINPKANFQLGQLYHQSQGNPEIVVAIIDGAIDGQHADFSQTNLKMLDDSQTVTCDSADAPSCQHGTFITGILAANRDSQAPGICPQCTFLARPIFCQADDLASCPPVTQQQLADAVNQCIDAGADIINMSVGLSGQPEPLSAELKQAYDKAKQNDVLLVGASGNQFSEEVNSIFAHPWVIAVSAVDAQGQILPSANTGQWVAEHGLLAPGDQITSTAAGGGYKQMTGTSAAAPFVTGAAALLWSLNPSVTSQTIYDALMHHGPKQQANIPSALDGEASLGQLNRDLPANPREPQMMTTTPINTPSASSQANKAGDGSIEVQQIDMQQANIQSLSPQSCGCQQANGACSCQTDQPSPPPLAYAVGILTVTFPNQGVQQAFDSAAQQLKVSELDYYQVFSHQDSQTRQYPYLYLAAQAQWQLSIDGANHYLVVPRSIVELQQCIAALKPQPNTLQPVYSTVIGYIGPNDSQNSLPTLMCEQLFSQTMDELHNMLKSYTGASSDAIQDVIRQLELNPNAGDNDFARAKNYLAFRYPDVYQHTHQLKNKNSSNNGDANQYFLADVNCNYADIESNQTLVDVVFTYQANDSDQQKHYYCCVDVSGCFPFISSAIQPFIPYTLVS